MTTSRRTFALRTATALAAALATPHRLSAAPPRSFRVAIIGHTGRGDYGHGLDVMWHSVARTQVVAVADPQPAGLAAARQRLNGVPGYADYSVMLREVRPDIVAVTPRHVDEHQAMCLAAIAAGARGIYVEKPFCCTPREADDIVAACRERQVRLAVAHRNRHHPAFAVIRRLIARGDLGAVLEIRGRGKEDSRGGAQDLWVLGSHVFDLALGIAGPPSACSALLYQDNRPCTPEDLRPGAEGVGLIAGNRLHARFDMADGTPLFFDSRHNHGDRAAGFGLQIIGTSGTVDFRIDRDAPVHLRRGNPFTPTTVSQPWLPVSSAGVDEPEPIPTLHQRIASHQAAGDDLVAAIEGNHAPLCDAEAGRTTIEMICATFESHRQGGSRVVIPLAHRDHPFARG